MSPPRPALRAAFTLFALLTGCAAVRPTAPACPGCLAEAAAPTAAPAGLAQLIFEPQPIVVGPVDLELAGKNDEELFAIGQAAFAAGEFERAAAAFDRLADLHPGSRRQAAALYHGGLAHERLEQWRLALERFISLERRAAGADAMEATFKIAECRYHLDELQAAAEVLAGLAARTDLPPGEKIRALTQLGIVELEAGKPDDAERHLRLAVSAWKAGSDQERLDGATLPRRGLPGPLPGGEARPVPGRRGGAGAGAGGQGFAAAVGTGPLPPLHQDGERRLGGGLGLPDR
jgi:TolA-binding protein